MIEGSLQGAVVLYLNLATIFALTFRLIWELICAASANLPASVERPGRTGHDAVFQPHYTDHDRMWGCRAGRPIRIRHRRAPLANGASIGASHQTVWTGVIAGLIDIFGHLDAQIYLEGGRAAALRREKRR